jgi:hypothetical protein
MMSVVPRDRLRQAACRVHNLAIGAAERLHRFNLRSCPCCGWTGLAFRSYVRGDVLHSGVFCPQCGSFERHRALASFYPAFFASTGVRPSRLIHCAPERCLAPILTSLCDRYETSAFGEAYAADHRLDLTAVALPPESCDAFVLNHVLDCMVGDAVAVSEMYRVLRPGGIVLAVVTVGQGVTREVPVQSNSLRRIYGTADMSDRFAPFGVTIVEAAGDVAPDARRLSGLPRVLPVLVLRKPAAA